MNLRFFVLVINLIVRFGLGLFWANDDFSILTVWSREGSCVFTTLLPVLVLFDFLLRANLETVSSVMAKPEV